MAYPDASPWGAANPAADETCSTCHYDYDAVRDSAALEIAGLPAEAAPGETYALVVRMTGVETAVSGLQLLATDGVFSSDDAALETAGNAIRSTEAATNGGRIEWKLAWRAPQACAEAVEIYLAVSAANDDQSPFGDTIHYRRFVIAVAGSPPG